MSDRVRRTPLAITERQLALLFVIDQNSPASVGDVAYHLHMDDAAARSRLATLERRGWLDRQYTGHGRDSLFAYVLTDDGASELEAADADFDLEEVEF